MTRPTLHLNCRHPALIAGFDNQLDVLVRLEAPLPPEETPERSALNLAIVLDRSGSMSGQPLREARRCAHFLVDQLGDLDRVSIVAYDSHSTVVSPSSLATDKVSIHAAIRTIESAGMTDLHGGWLQGAEQSSAHIRSDHISRVILLSDGQVNRGVVDRDEIARQCAELADAGVSTSTYGLGDGFNEQLMVQMARSGQGNSYYGQTADDLMDPFREEFDLLSALCARQVRFQVCAPDGVSVEVLNRYSMDEDGGLRVPDLAYSGEVWAVVRLRVPQEQILIGENEQTTIVTLRCSYQDLDGALHELEPAMISLPALPAAAWNAVVEDEMVAERVAELEAANIQDKAQRAARQGNWGEVRRLLHEVRTNAKDNEWLGQVATTLERLARQEDREVFAKEATYASSRMRNRMTTSSLACSMGSEFDSEQTFLRKKKAQGKATGGPRKS